MTVRVDAPPSLVPSCSVGPLPPTPIAERPIFEFRPELNPRSETHRINLANRRLDLADYERYVDRWVAGLERCRTPEEVAEYGPAEPPPTRTPWGTSPAEQQDYDRIGHHADVLYRRSFGSKADAELRAAGLAVPLSVELSASAQVGVAAGDRQIAVGASIGPSGVTVDATFGSTVQRITTSAGPSTPFSAGRQVGVPGATVTTSGGERLDRLELEAFPSAPASPFVASDGRSVELGVRAGRDLNEGPVRVAVEGRASVKVNLLSRDVAYWALTHRSERSQTK